MKGGSPPLCKGSKIVVGTVINSNGSLCNTGSRRRLGAGHPIPPFCEAVFRVVGGFVSASATRPSPTSQRLQSGQVAASILRDRPRGCWPPGRQPRWAGGAGGGRGARPTGSGSGLRLGAVAPGFAPLSLPVPGAHLPFPDHLVQDLLGALHIEERRLPGPSRRRVQQDACGGGSQFRSVTSGSMVE